MVRLRRAGGVTSRTMFLSFPMVTASPAFGTFPSGQDLGSDQRVCATPEAGAWTGMLILEWSSCALAGAQTPSSRDAGSSQDNGNRRDGMRMTLIPHAERRVPHILGFR